MNHSRYIIIIIIVITDLRQNVRNVVNPVGERAVNQVVNGQRFPLGVDDEVLPADALFLLLGLLVELVVADRRDVRAGADACDLRSKVIDLLARVRRVADDLLEPAHEGPLSRIAA